VSEISFLPANPVALPRNLAGEQDKSLHRAQVAFFFLLLFTVVIYGRPEDIFLELNSIPLAKIIAILAALSYLMSLLSGRAAILWTRELTIMCTLTGWFIACLPFAYWKSNSLNSLTGTWFKTLLIFFLFSQIVISLGRIRKLLWAIIFCGLVSASYSLIHQSDWVSQNGDRLRGDFGFYATFYLSIAAGVTFPFIAVLFTLTRSFIKRALLAAVVGVLTLMVVLGAFRSDFLSVILTIVLTWIYVLRKSRWGRLLGVIFALVFVVALANAPAIFWQRMSTLWSSPSQLTSVASVSALESTALRKLALRYSIMYTLHHPIFGLGIGNFRIAFGTDVRSWNAWIGTHNMYTQISSEAGIPGLVLFVGLLLAVLRNMSKVSKISSDDPQAKELRLFARATIACTLSFMFAGLFAHVAYDGFFYYVVGISTSLQFIAQRMGAASLAGGRPPIGRAGFRRSPEFGEIGNVSLGRS
jgi:O-antigen ligase